LILNDVSSNDVLQMAVRSGRNVAPRNIFFFEATRS